MSGEKRVEGVTCHRVRLVYYSIAFLMSFGSLFAVIYTLCLENGTTMPIYLYAIYGGTSILYLGMVIRCLCKDVPVPSYRLGVDGRFNFFLAVMIFMYCISYSSQGKSRLVASLIGLILIVAGISIAQLSWPAEDVTPNHIIYTLQLGAVFGILGGVGTISWSGFVFTLLYFPLFICIISEFDQ